MKDKIFIIWSGTNQVAQKVKNILENEYNYICYIGGNYNNDSQMVSIGDTVIRQMKSCNQAIVIFQNKDTGVISNNLFYELGYVSSEYEMKKVHCVRKMHDNILLPSDFDNSFVEPLEDINDDIFAHNIVSYFIGRQKLSVDTNKMYLINNRHIMHEMINSHCSEVGSKCSDYELAQYILFYAQGAVMFQDDAKVLEELRDFKKIHNKEVSHEVQEALNISIALLDVQTHLINKDDNVYVDSQTFRAYFNMCKDMLEDIQDDDMGSFDEWAKVIAAENLAYVTSLYSLNPEINSDMRSFLMEKVIEYGKRCIGYIETLEKNTPCIENNDEFGLISVFKGYIYRHIFLACKALGKSEATDWIKKSLKERKELLRHFDKYSIDTNLYRNFEMEYYLNLGEYLNFVGKDNVDPFDYMMYLSDIDTFISEYANKDHLNAYIKKITNQRKEF